jgi:hypothetical protein
LERAVTEGLAARCRRPCAIDASSALQGLLWVKVGPSTDIRAMSGLPLQADLLIDHDEGHLSPSRLHYNVTPATNDPRSPKFFKHCDQCDVIDEVDVQEECDFQLRETALHGPGGIGTAR